MVIYIINAIFAGLVTTGLYTYCDENGFEEYWSIRKKKNALTILFIVLVTLYALRGVTGTDSGSYYLGYINAYRNGLSIFDLFESYRDKLYQMLVYTVGRLTHGNWIAMCTTVGIIIYFPILKLIREKSVDVQLSVLVFLMSLDAYFGYNGVRQMLGVSLSVYAFYFCLKEKKYAKYIILMAIALGFHASAIFIIPFHIIATRELKSSLTKVVVFTMIGLSFAFEKVWNYFFEAFSDNNVIENYGEMFVGANGSGILRVFVMAAPVVLALINYRSIREKYDNIDADIILSIFSVIFMIYSTINASFSQMCIYFSLANTILISKVMDCVDNDRRSLRMLAILLYFINMVLLLNHGDMGLNPYTPIWNM